ncbi:MAG TPA: hypothetical protein VII01_16275 [Solirubrobacteraceae bacterium]
MTARVALISWTARLGAITAVALARREQVGLPSARARLAAAHRAGLLERHRPLAGAPALYSASRAGLRVAGLTNLEPARVSPATAGHTIACAGVAAALERAFPDHRLVGERELLSFEREQGAPCQSAVRLRTRAGVERTHRPDLVLCPPAGSALPLAVEIELSVKAPARLAEICLAWARSREFAGVLYVVSLEASQPVQRAVARTRAGRRISLIAIDAIRTQGLADPPERTVPGDA